MATSGGRHYRVVVIPAPDNRWTFVVEWRHAKSDPDPYRTSRAPSTYATHQQAGERGAQYAEDLIARESV